MTENGDKQTRRRSSDGQTPKPSSKMLKMAEGDSGDSDDVGTKIIDQMTVIADAVSQLQKGQKELRSSFDSKFDKFKNEFMASIDSKFKAMRSDFDLELGKQQSQIDSLSRSVESLIHRVKEVEKVGHSYATQPGSAVHHSSTVKDSEVTIIASNIPQSDDEDILQVAQDLVDCLSDSISVVAAARLRSRIQGKPGLVKISFATVEEKVEILRKKRDLKGSQAYKSVFLRSSKSHTERLIELNAKTLLTQIPNGEQFRITSNGRIVKKDSDRQHSNFSADSNNRDQDHQ